MVLVMIVYKLYNLFYNLNLDVCDVFFINEGIFEVVYKYMEEDMFFSKIINVLIVVFIICWGCLKFYRYLEWLKE